MSLPRPLYHHRSLITTMKRFGYLSNSEGVCFGVAHMGKQAILANDIKNFNHHIQTLLDVKEIKEPSLENQLEIRAFFDGIELYFQSHRYPSLFDLESRPFRQNTKSAASLITSSALEAKGGSINLNSFFGIYNSQELIDYLRTLKLAMNNNKCNAPVALVLNNCLHAITIGFDPVKQRWIFIDANNLPAEDDIQSEKELAKKIMSGFSSSGQVAFHSKLYVAGNNKNSFRSMIKEWQSNEVWQEMHETTSIKAKLKPNSNLPGLLHVAILHEDIDLLEKVLQAGADPNLPYGQQQFTPLYLAVHSGKMELVKKLLEYGADPQLKLANGSTAFDLAFERNHGEIIKLILKNKVQLTFMNGESLLHKAVEKKDLDVFKLALESGQNINAIDKLEMTPLYLAASNNDIEMVKLLLLNGADTEVGLNPRLIATLNNNELLVSLLDQADDYRKLRQEINSLEEKSSPIRKKAIRYLQQLASETIDVDFLKRSFNYFKQVDEISEKLLNITETYHSKNPKRLKNLAELDRAITYSYNMLRVCKNDQDVKYCVSSLVRTAKKISSAAQKEHTHDASFFSSRHCRLTTEINNVLLKDHRAQYLFQ